MDEPVVFALRRPVTRLVLPAVFALVKRKADGASASLDPQSHGSDVDEVRLFGGGNE